MAGTESTSLKLKSISEILSLVTIAVGILVIIGWAFNISILLSPGEGFSTIKSNVGVGFILIGLSLWFIQDKRNNLRNRRISQILSFIVFLIGFLTLFQDLSGINLSIDQILFKEAPGALYTIQPNRMALFASISLVLLGLASIFIDYETKKGHRPAQYLFLGTGILSLLALVGYAYNASFLYYIASFTGIALYAALTFFIIFLGFLFARPDHGFMRTFNSDLLGSKNAYRLLLPSLILIIVLGWIWVQGRNLGFYKAPYAISLFTISTIIIIFALIWKNTIYLNQADLEIRDYTDKLQKSRDNLEIEVEERTYELVQANKSLKNEIQEREKYEAALHESEKRFKSVFENATVGVCLTGLDGKFLMVNEKLAEILGYSSQELLNLKFADLTYPDDLEKSMDLLNSLLKGGEDTRRIEKRYIHKNGQIVWVDLSSFIYKNDQGNPEYFITHIQDITRRKNVEKDLDIKMNELERSNQELEQFAYIASHDLQEPLRMVSSYLQLIEKRYADKLDQDGHEFMDFAVDGAERMQKMINDLLIYSRVTTRGKEFEFIDINAVLEEVLKNLEVSIKETGAQINFDDLPVIKADPSQMVQLFQNLISNSIRFRSLQDPVINISVHENSEKWIFSLEDNGIGIDPQYTPKIFEVFKRLHTRDKYPGTGIGLAICKKIVERHGGDIRVESELNKGSKFIFTISKNPED